VNPHVITVEDLFVLLHFLALQAEITMFYTLENCPRLERGKESQQSITAPARQQPTNPQGKFVPINTITELLLNSFNIISYTLQNYAEMKIHNTETESMPKKGREVRVKIISS
jgi:hypothetical protein